MTVDQRASQSPCVKVCVIEEGTGLCTGCLRTLDEIANWRDLDVDQRAAVLASIAGRRPSVAPETGAVG